MESTHGSADAAERVSTGRPASGFHVDSHFSWLRTRMAAESTLMSWNRTALSLIGFGFTIYQFFEKFQTATAGDAASRPDAPRNLGLAFVAVGTIALLIALWQYRHLVDYLNGAEFEAIAAREGVPRSKLTQVVTLFLAMIGIVTFGWILLRGG